MWKSYCLATAHIFLNGQFKVINGCIMVYGAKTFPLSADQKGHRGFQRTKLCPIWIPYAKVIGVWSLLVDEKKEKKKKGEPDGKVVDILKISMYLLCNIRVLMLGRCWF